ncbi:DUF3422 family protein [Undibacterium sp. Ji49W]|uniref:DUF3422 family protein n=1 Tax=Undibacterium sp. Ji49W TaxID=3413040 RepID=UPI003BF3474F
MSIIYSTLNHQLRVPLASEIHSRPFLKLQAPERISHLAVYSGAESKAVTSIAHEQHALLAALCAHFAVAAPAGTVKYFYHDFGRFRLKWECHAEFATYTFAESLTEVPALGDMFDDMPVTQLPGEWLLRLQGKMLVAAHVALCRNGESTEQFARSLARVFEGNVLAGSHVMQGGELWSDFAIQADGFSRFVIRDIDMRAMQAGRLVQRILEIETYRMMALLGLPYAQQAATSLNSIENELVALSAAMVKAGESGKENAPEQDGVSVHDLLDQIMRLAARIEKLALDNSYRFSASQAYFRIIEARIEELREVRIEGIPTIEEFMDRRLTPAMNTCVAMLNRQEALAQRIANTNDLLRTRVGIVQEAQNRQILQSMNARAAQQLRLQQAVEGLSVAAISYYVTGLFSYVGKAIKQTGVNLNTDLFTGIMVPLVVGAVWLSLRHMHKKMHAH